MGPGATSQRVAVDEAATRNQLNKQKGTRPAGRENRVPQPRRNYRMTRPEDHADLTDWQRQGHLVAAIPSEYITRYPSLGQHLLAAVAEADRIGLQREADGSIRIPLTDDELDAKVRSEQRSWDYNAERWEKSIEGDPEACPSYMRTTVDMWAKAEGRDAVDWAALDEEAAR